MDPSQFATVPLGRDREEGSRPLAAVFSVGGASGRAGGAWVRVLVYTGRSGSSCGLSSGRLLWVVLLPVDLRAAEGRSAVVHDGWVPIGSGRKKGQLFLTVRAEPNPRFVFQFDGEPECSPQVFQILGNDRQAVFTCKFSCRSFG